MRAVPMLAAYSCVLLAGSPTSVVGLAGATQRAGMTSPVYLIIRTADAGMTVQDRNVLLTTYRDPITKQGLKAMRRPVG